MTETMQYNQAGHVNRQSDTFHTGRGSAAHHGGIGPAARIASWRWKPRVAHIQNAAAADVGRGSETMMTFARGDLFHAARWLKSGGHKAMVVTGFYIPQAERPAAESDGPAGAVELCEALRAIGSDAWLISDEPCAPVIRAGASSRLPEDHVAIAPADAQHFDQWIDAMRGLVDHHGIDTIIYIERVGPARDGNPRNMRGFDIDRWTAPLSRLTGLGLHVIGIGDGGNEIGMGRLDSIVIEDVVEHGERIACTVPADELIVSGTSNWGGHALVCAMYAMGCRRAAPLLDIAWHRAVLADVARAGGLDGVTMRNTPTVDGLSEERYYRQIRMMSDIARGRR